jgi:hypothetical protein
MTLAQFENGYWYATELKKFAETIGVPSATKLRKDELEKAIRRFLQTGTIESPTKRSLAKTGIKDVEKGLQLKLPVVHYTSTKQTKDFIVSEALKIDPGLRRKSGARYRLNRWARRTAHARPANNLRRPGEAVCEIESNERGIHKDSTCQVHKFSQ